MPLNPLSILARYSNKDTSQSLTTDRLSIQDKSTQSEANTPQTRTPSQQLADVILEKYHLNTLLPMVGKFIPGMSIGGIFDDLNDPVSWHNALAGISSIVNKVLQEDYDGGHVECDCHKPYSRSSDTTETGEGQRISSSSESVLRGDDRQREIYPDASSDAQLHSELQHSEIASEDVDSGHQAEVQGHVGVKWPNDLSDW